MRRIQRTFLSGRARFVGETVAVVAADTQDIAQQALDLIDVRWDVLEIFPDVEENLRRDNRQIHAGGSVSGFGGPQPADVPTWEARVGNLDAGFAEADRIVAGRYVTSRQVTLPIETHVCTAMWKGDELYLWDSQQSVFAARATLAETLRIREEQVHIYAEYVGGGFGGKCLDYADEDLYQLYAAILAKQTGRPVRFEGTLNEEMATGDSRHPFIFETRWGVKKDGTITAQYWKVLADTGPYDSSGARRRPHRLPASGRHLPDAQLHRGGLRGLHQQSGWLVNSAASAGCRRRSRRNCMRTRSRRNWASTRSTFD